jgi:hypothetical protein
MALSWMCRDGFRKQHDQYRAPFPIISNIRAIDPAIPSIDASEACISGSDPKVHRMCFINPACN